MQPSYLVDPTEETRTFHSFLDRWLSTSTNTGRQIFATLLAAKHAGIPITPASRTQNRFFSVTPHSLGLPGCAFATPAAAETSNVVR